MPSEHGITPYRRLYALLLRLYPRQYRERFGEGMDQTFADLCRERTTAGKSLFTFALWMFGDTVAGMLSVRIAYFFSHLVMNAKHVLRPALVTLLLLIIPLLGSRYVEGWNWDGFDFVFAAVIFFAFSFAYEMLARNGSAASYRAASGIAVLTAFLLVWINAAVGIIGNDTGVNLLYFGVLAIGIICACIARFRPRGMGSALFVTAAGQLLVPVIVLPLWGSEIFLPSVPKVFLLNAVFAASFAASAVLFRRAAMVRA